MLKELKHKEICYKELKHKEICYKELKHKEICYKELKHKEISHIGTIVFLTLISTLLLCLLQPLDKGSSLVSQLVTHLLAYVLLRRLERESFN